MNNLLYYNYLNYDNEVEKLTIRDKEPVVFKNYYSFDAIYLCPIERILFIIRKYIIKLLIKKIISQWHFDS